MRDAPWWDFVRLRCGSGAPPRRATAGRSHDVPGQASGGGFSRRMPRALAVALAVGLHRPARVVRRAEPRPRARRRTAARRPPPWPSCPRSHSRSVRLWTFQSVDERRQVRRQLLGGRRGEGLALRQHRLDCRRCVPSAAPRNSARSTSGASDSAVVKPRADPRSCVRTASAKRRLELGSPRRRWSCTRSPCGCPRRARAGRGALHGRASRARSRSTRG